MTDVPTIAISIGDPAGIGPEVTIKALRDDALRNAARWILVGEDWQVRTLGRSLGFQPDQVVDCPADMAKDATVVVLRARQLPESELTVGKARAACGKAGLEYVRLAAQLCLCGNADAMVTGPLCKEAVALNGIDFCGHTEFLAELCGVQQSRMLLHHEKFSVVHVSTHCSLVEAAKLSVDRIRKTIELGHEAMIHLKGTPPRIAVCGLNPHAGENGLFGNEEAQFIGPAVEKMCAQGISCEGPLPADALFMQAVRGRYDLIVAMYHDQGHVAMKLMDFEHTVNVTLGLPIVRVSVDHGTAFDIAGRGLASCDDMQVAMRLAIRMAANKVFAESV